MKPENFKDYGGASGRIVLDSKYLSAYLSADLSRFDKKEVRKAWRHAIRLPFYGESTRPEFRQWIDSLQNNPDVAEQCEWKKLSNYEWNEFISRYGDFAWDCIYRYAKSNFLGRLLANNKEWKELGLIGYYWQNILTEYPQYAVKCPWAELDAENLAVVLSVQPQLEKYCNLSRFNGMAWAILLAAQPQYAERCDWSKFNSITEWAVLLKSQPQFADKCNWNEFSSNERSLVLHGAPQFADKCKFHRLDGEHWCKLLQCQPQFAEFCDWEKLNDYDWEGLLAKQPQFADKRCDVNNKKDHNAATEKAKTSPSKKHKQSDAECQGEISGIEFSEDGKTLLLYPDDLMNEYYEIPDGVEVIGPKAFNCANVKTLVFPSSLKCIKAEAFMGVCSDEIILPEGLETIEYGAFWGAEIKKISLPRSLRYVEEFSFYACWDLVEVISHWDEPKCDTKEWRENYSEEESDEGEAPLSIFFNLRVFGNCPNIRKITGCKSFCALVKEYQHRSKTPLPEDNPDNWRPYVGD